MPDDLFIEKRPELRPSQDFDLLRRTGIEYIERLGHASWTDYNVHDPGITILELLCYAITDLGYRTSFLVKDLLTRESGGEPYNAGTFHTAQHVLPTSPVTFDDLRKLLIDIAGVRNAWIEKHRSVVYLLDRPAERLTAAASPVTTANPPLNGLFDVLIEYEDYVEHSRTVHFGLLERRTPGDYISPGSRGIAFHAEYELTIKAVSVYARRPGAPADPVDVTVRLLDESGTVELATATVTIETPEEKSRIELGFRVTPGEGYRLVASGADVELYREADAAYPFSIENVIHLVSGIHGDTPLQQYYFFYDWEIGYAVPPPSEIPEYTEDLVIEQVGIEDHTVAGGYIAADGRGIVFDAERDVLLEAVSVYADAPGPVTIRLLDASDAVLESASGEVSAADTRTRIPLWFTVPAGTDYRLDAQGTGLNLYRATTADFPFEIEDVITLKSGTPAAGSYYFFFSWEVSYTIPTGLQIQAPGVTREDIRLEVIHRLHSHRNLCEDFVNVCELEVEEIAVCADLEATPDADVEEVLAEIFYQLERHVSPPIRFYTIQELLDRGKTVDEIFEGPLLDHGFIDDDEFRQIQRICRIRTSDLIQIMMDVPGVRSVKEISLLSFIEGELRTQEPWVLDLATDTFRAPTFSAERSKIIFYKRGLPYYPSRRRVMELLDEKMARDIETKLKNHERDLPLPVGSFKDLTDYYPIQNELPATYMVGELRVPDSYGETRKAQARQLRAFLLFFEQILADYLAQLGNLDKIFSWTSGPARSYFTQPVEGIADLAEVYADYPELSNDLTAIAEDPGTAGERRLRFLGHLAGRFAEDFTDYSLLLFNQLGEEDGRSRVIADEEAFLADYGRLSSERINGYDYRYPGLESNVGGFQRRMYRLLGMRREDGAVARRDLAGHRFRTEQVGDQWRFVLRDETDASNLFESILCERKSSIEVLLDFALTIGGDVDNYEVNETDDGFELLRVCRSDAESEAIGRTTSKEVLEEVVAYFADFAEREGFHLVEHVLLRRRTEDDPFLPVQLHTRGECRCVEVAEPYSFRMSIILPSWPARFRDIKFRQHVEESIRMETPAHIFPRICWINHSQMIELENAYNAWSDGLAALDDRLGPCHGPAESSDAGYWRSGQLPLPPTEAPDQDHSDAMQSLIDILFDLDNVYPLARLHDCEETTGDAPQITLNHTSLGTF